MAGGHGNRSDYVFQPLKLKQKEPHREEGQEYEVVLDGLAQWIDRWHVDRRVLG